MSSAGSVQGHGLQVLAVLLDARRPLETATVARALGGTAGGVREMLCRLEAKAFVTRDKTGRWCLPAGGATTLPAALVGRLNLRAAARPVLQRLAATTGETVTLNVRNRGHRMRVDAVEGRPPALPVPVGETLPLHTGTAGKVLLAHLGRPAVERALARARAEGHDERRLGEQLQAIRLRGYLAAVDARRADVAALSAPVFGPSGIAAALSVVGPAERWGMERMEEAAALVCAECAHLSVALGAPSPSW